MEQLIALEQRLRGTTSMTVKGYKARLLWIAMGRSVPSIEECAVLLAQHDGSIAQAFEAALGL